jgi:hypothetical protein
VDQLKKALTESQAQAKRMAGAVVDNWKLYDDDLSFTGCIHCTGSIGNWHGKHKPDCPVPEAEEMLSNDSKG